MVRILSGEDKFLSVVIMNDEIIFCLRKIGREMFFSGRQGKGWIEVLEKNVGHFYFSMISEIHQEL